MKKSFCLLLFLMSFHLNAEEQETFEPSAEIRQIENRIWAHLILQDTRTAYDEVQQGLLRNSSSPELQKALIRVLIRLGDEQAFFAAWSKYKTLVKDPYQHKDILELMAWGIIEKASTSSAPITRALASLAAFFSSSQQSVRLLARHMQDPNSLVRGVATQLSGGWRDRLLTEQVLRILKEEKVWSVKMAALASAGNMKLEEAKPYLESVLNDERSLAEEKAVAVQSLVSLMEDARRDEIKQLTISSRAGLRLLGCEVVGVLGKNEDVDLLIPLLTDPRPEVRAACLEILGILRTTHLGGQEVKQIALQLSQDHDPHVSIAAAWLLTLHDPKEGGAMLAKWLKHTHQEWRCLAAAALASTGTYGAPYIYQEFKNTTDVYVKLNLAVGLIQIRHQTKAACDAIFYALRTEKERWMWEDRDIFHVLAPSTAKHRDEIPNYPEAVNQLVRLELIQILAFMNDPRAQEALKTFIKEKTFGITGLASALLLTEGDDEAVDIVKELLKEQDPQIRLQAAVILALWGRDVAAVEELQNSYLHVDREMQEKILESLGKIGDSQSIPFLTDRLGDPHQHIRIIAASSLLQCLDH